jgi:hypothetical protein
MDEFKNKLRKKKFIEEMNKFISENGGELIGEDMNLLSALCNLVWVKFRQLDEESKIEIVESILLNVINIDIKLTIKFLINNNLIKEPTFKSIALYYINKYILKKKPLM